MPLPKEYIDVNLSGRDAVLKQIKKAKFFGVSFVVAASAFKTGPDADLYADQRNKALTQCHGDLGAHPTEQGCKGIEQGRIPLRH